ncbi:hypothetical protein [Kitasatospora sp. GP82]|uniref:hypothetical protein n=1 Tax=Kitasatospora sp. GP82 TaxID=3035089 RepID=UPI00247531BF|nr:hypothetical protein [Kitasatospora sp. GP82]MDH6123523.1 hypothetical protein [Kitasatospora sp. GP82]
MSSTAATAQPQTAAEAGAAAEPLPTVAEMQLPTWFFGFEGVLAGAFDILHAFPWAWPALVVLALVNIGVSLTLMRKRLRLAKMLWRGKGTRKVAFMLLGLRLGSHALLAMIGIAVTSVLVHVAFAVVMAALTVGLLAYTQRTALRALVTAGKITA